MPSKIRLFTSFSLCLTVVWAALVCFGVQEVFGAEAKLKRAKKYEKRTDSVVLGFQSGQPTKKTAALKKVKLPLKLAKSEKVADVVGYGNTILLATLNRKVATVY